MSLDEKSWQQKKMSRGHRLMKLYELSWEGETSRRTLRKVSLHYSKVFFSVKLKNQDCQCAYLSLRVAAAHARGLRIMHGLRDKDQ